MKFRNPKHDEFKSDAQMRIIFKDKKKCKHTDCNNLLTERKGPGQDLLCREHQKQLREYGGFGRLDRLHTFHRDFVCEECGYDPREDPQITCIEDDYDRMRVIRGVMHGDHQHLKSEGGSDTADNIRTVCVRCHMIKTYRDKDYLGGKNLTEQSADATL